MTQHEKEIEEFGNNDDFWLFGYGSLLWKPPPHYGQRVPGYIEGYVRRFWQASEDHRGTPSAPGRVVTLITHAHWETLTDHHEAPERVWGAAYHIPSIHVPSVREYLDIREINGYSIQFTPFHPAPNTTQISSPPPDQQGTCTSFVPAGSIRRQSTVSITTEESKSIRCLVYIGLPENPQFVGPQDPDALAKKVLESRGPSGENREYLFNLEKALMDLSKESEDAHVSDLVRRCKALEVSGWGKRGKMEGGRSEPLHKVGSTEEQEEVEK